MRLFLFTGAFWGIFLIVIGLALLAKQVFNIDFPIWRFIWAIFLIMLGVQFLIGFNMKSKGDTTIFSDGILEYREGQKEYNTIFGKGFVDLSHLPADEDIKIKADCVFGEMVVRINDSASVKVKGSSAFGNAHMPNGSNASFGDTHWTSTGYDESKPTLYVKAEAVFGQIRVEK